MLNIKPKTLTLKSGQGNADDAVGATERQSPPPGRIPANLMTVTRAKRREFVDARHEKNAIEHVISLPKKDESLHLIVDGRFEPCDIIPATRRMSDPATIKSLTVTTLGLNEDNVAQICRGIDAGKIGTATIIVSHYFRGAERPLYEWMKTEVEQRGGRVRGLRTHAKIMLMEMTDGNWYSVEGSANLRSCKSVEQMVITNSQPLLEFHQAWIEDFITSSKQK